MLTTRPGVPAPIQVHSDNLMQETEREREREAHCIVLSCRCEGNSFGGVRCLIVCIFLNRPRLRLKKKEGKVKWFISEINK